MSLTTNPNDPNLGHGSDNVRVVQNKKYLVLPDNDGIDPLTLESNFVRPIRNKYIHTKCGGETKMGDKIAETYAKNPKFYGSTYCVYCQMHKPVGEFLWSGTNEKVGS